MTGALVLLSLAFTDARPGIHRIEKTATQLIVHTAGIGSESLAPVDANGHGEARGAQSLALRLPLFPKAAARAYFAPMGIVGVFDTGAAIYNPISAHSYRDQNLWHFDAVRQAGELSQGLRGRWEAKALIGYALDGFPVLATGLRSSYRLRQIARRDTLPDGTRLAPGQEGPEVGGDFPLGVFAEDYEYVSGSGELDEANGRLDSQGRYAYHLAADAEGRLAYPYLIGPKLHGEIALESSANELRFSVPGWRYLKKVHEKPMHLIVTSADLKYFDHVHPELTPRGDYSIDYRFPAPGQYVLFAGYTAAGQAPKVERIEHRVTWDREPVVGSDLNLKVSLTDRETGHPVRNLEPWLGAWGHIVMVHEDTREFLHIHPKSEGGDHHDLRGPSPAAIEASTGFARPGRYQAWLQYQRDGKVATAPFEVLVAAPVGGDSGVGAASAVAAASMAGVASRVGAASGVGVAVQVADAAAGTVVPRVRVTANGFEPARLGMKDAGEVEFVREDARGCGQVLRIDSLGLKLDLPLGQPVRVKLPASAQGEIRFTCGMGMLKGALVVTGL